MAEPGLILVTGVGGGAGGVGVGNKVVALLRQRGLAVRAMAHHDDDRAIDPALQRSMAQRAGSTTVEFSAASHVGGLTHYKARFVKLIEQAIDATAT